MSDLAYYIISMPEKQFAYFFGILATKNPDKIRVYAEHVFFYVLIITETEGFEPSCPKRANAFRVRPVMTTSIRLHIQAVNF